MVMMRAWSRSVVTMMMMMMQAWRQSVVAMVALRASSRIVVVRRLGRPHWRRRRVVLAVVMWTWSVGQMVRRRRLRVVAAVVVKSQSMMGVWSWCRRMVGASVVESRRRHYRSVMAVVMMRARSISIVTVVRHGRRNQKQRHHHSHWQSNDFHGDKLLITSYLNVSWCLRTPGCSRIYIILVKDMEMETCNSGETSCCPNHGMFFIQNGD
jgi:hypothetical protein